MPRGLASSTFMKPFVVLALPGMYLFYKYSQYRQQQQEQNRRKVTERELAHLNHKIDKLLTKLEENEPELATSQEDECVICVNAKATMQTSPCGHRVVCRKCFVKTIQMAVSQRLLPLRCVICRAKILRLKQSGGAGAGMLLPHCGAKGWGLQSSTSSYTVGNGKWLVPGSASSYSMGKTWVVPSSASQYSMGRDVPNSESLYSMSSGSSSFSGVSSVSSATTSSQGSSKSGKGGSRLTYPRQPTGSLRKSQTQSMKLRIQDYKEPMRAPCIKEQMDKPARLPPIAEFQREFRASKERSGSNSTRIRCAQKIVTQLETTPLLKPHGSPPPTSYFRSPLKPANQDDIRKGARRKEFREPLVKSEKDENSDNNKKEEKLNKKLEKKDGKVEKKDEKKDAKAEKKETKAEKEERKKEAKAEKKLLKLEAKAEKKKEKKEAKEAKEAAKAAEKREKL